jgi:hypothetical protein
MLLPSLLLLAVDRLQMKLCMQQLPCCRDAGLVGTELPGCTRKQQQTKNLTSSLPTGMYLTLACTLLGVQRLVIFSVMPMGCSSMTHHKTRP